MNSLPLPPLSSQKIKYFQIFLHFFHVILIFWRKIVFLKNLNLSEENIILWSLKGPEVYLCHFFFFKKSRHIRKDASVFHLKSGNSCKLNYFLTSTPSRHTSHHRSHRFFSRSIASHQFFTCKYDRPTTGSRLWTWTNFLSQLDILSLLPFPSFY
jgi:hypothetical protein